MPKRKNPFGDTAPVQLKTHIGFKQVATEADKQEVYERTRALLFQGANPQLKHFPNGAENVPPLAMLANYDSHVHGHSITHSNGVHFNGVLSSDNCNGLSNDSSGLASEANTCPPTTACEANGILKYFSNGMTRSLKSETKELTNGHPVSTVCKCCRRVGVKLVMECAHCERSVCGVEGCIRECQVCHQILCQFCTVLNYTVKDVRTFCFDCLPMVT